MILRVVHLPTGLVGTSDQHTSLLEAKQEALTRLRERMEAT